MHIFRDLLNVKAVPGEDAELSCEITKPEVTIRWLKNGRLIKESPKYEMSVEKHLARLVIKSTTIRDSGEYCCEAEGVASRAKLEIRGSLDLTFHSFLVSNHLQVVVKHRLQQIERIDIVSTLICLWAFHGWIGFTKLPFHFRVTAHICQGAERHSSRRKRKGDTRVRDEAASQACDLAEGLD